MSLPRWFSVLLTCVFCAVLSAGTASAVTGETLTLTSSTVVDGDTNLSIHPVIELEFSGKVDDLTILSRNKDCFHLQDASGAVLTLQVLFPDVQVQTRLVNHVFLVPKDVLQPGASYTLTVDRALSDKKERTLDRSYRMTFTTGTDEVYARGAENEDLQNLGEDILVYETASAPAAETAVVTTPGEADAASPSGTSTSKLLRIAIPVLILLLGAVGFWNVRTSRRSSTDA